MKQQEQQHSSNSIQMSKYMLTIISIVSLLLGAGVTYGITQTKVVELERRTGILERKVDEITVMATDIKWIKQELKKITQ